MTTLVKIQRKGQVTLPTRFRSAVGVAEGDLVEVSLQRGKIVLTPQLIVDRSQFPNADDEYTPAQRKTIDREIAKGMADVKAGRTYGPFSTAADMAASIEAEIKKSRRTGKTSKPVR